jgi:hypothetical protein
MNQQIGFELRPITGAMGISSQEAGAAVNFTV